MLPVDAFIMPAAPSLPVRLEMAHRVSLRPLVRLSKPSGIPSCLWTSSEVLGLGVEIREVIIEIPVLDGTLQPLVYGTNKTTQLPEILQRVAVSLRAFW